MYTCICQIKKGSAAKKKTKQDYEDSVREIAKKASKYYGTRINPKNTDKSFDKGLQRGEMVIDLVHLSLLGVMQECIHFLWVEKRFGLAMKICSRNLEKKLKQRS